MARRSPRPGLAWITRLFKAEDCSKCLVHGCQFVSGEMTDEVAESFGIDGSGLFDQDVRCLSLNFDRRASVFATPARCAIRGHG